MLGFSDGFAQIPNHPLFRTTDGGVTWSKVFTVPEPPGIPGTFVNDWTPDWGRNNQLSITMLAPSDIITVVTNNAIAPSAYCLSHRGWRRPADEPPRPEQLLQCRPAVDAHQPRHGARQPGQRLYGLG